MILSGFTDEAGSDLDLQIKATKELGWTYISARSINGVNIHDLPEEAFDYVAEQLEVNDIKVYEFGSLIGSWSKPISSDFKLTIEEIKRAIPRMQRLGTQYARIMSYGQELWGKPQREEERFMRLREIVKRFTDAGLTPLHENCLNWGGSSAEHTLRLIEEVPGMKLIFDTGNPVFQLDRSKPKPFPWQDPLEFYEKVWEYVAHVHIKDCLNPLEGETEPERYTFPGEGKARLAETLEALAKHDYSGGFAIEPHVAKVFHSADEDEGSAVHCFKSYVNYGKSFQAFARDNFLTHFVNILNT